MQTTPEKNKFALIKKSSPGSKNDSDPVASLPAPLLEPPIRPENSPLPNVKKPVPAKQTKKRPVVKRKRKVYRKQKGYRRRKKQKYKPEPLVLSLPTRGVKAPKPKGLLDYKNLPLLRQYLTAQGKIMSKKKTRLTSKEQRQVSDTIKTARTVAFLPFIRR